MKLRRHARGTSTLELFLVLAIFAVMLLGIYQLYRHYRWQQQLAETEYAVAQMQLSAVAYFYQHCRTTVWKNETIQADELGVDSRYISTPWLQNFALKIDTSKMPHQFLLVATAKQLPGTLSAADYHQLLSAEGIDSVFLWRMTPEALVTNKEAITTLLNRRYLPSESSSISHSPLWMLKSGLQGFNANNDVMTLSGDRRCQLW